MTTPRATSRYQATVAIADILATIKVFVRRDSQPWLEAANPAYPPILIEHNAILGTGDDPGPPRVNLAHPSGSGRPADGYAAGMSAQAGPAGRVEPPGRTPAAIRAELPEGLRARFDAEYRQALEEAKASYQLDRLNEVIQAWWQLAWARRSPTHEQALATGARLLGGDQVETIPINLDALRR
jgi:hypothetical protein